MCHKSLPTLYSSFWESFLAVLNLLAFSCLFCYQPFTLDSIFASYLLLLSLTTSHCCSLWSLIPTAAGQSWPPSLVAPVSETPARSRSPGVEERSVMQRLRDIYSRYLTANGSGGKGWHFRGPPCFRLRFQRLVTR